MATNFNELIIGTQIVVKCVGVQEDYGDYGQKQVVGLNVDLPYL